MLENVHCDSWSPLAQAATRTAARVGLPLVASPRATIPSVEDVLRRRGGAMLLYSSLDVGNGVCRKCRCTPLLYLGLLYLIEQQLVLIIIPKKGYRCSI